MITDSFTGKYVKMKIDTDLTSEHVVTQFGRAQT